MMSEMTRFEPPILDQVFDVFQRIPMRVVACGALGTASALFLIASVHEYPQPHISTFQCHLSSTPACVANVYEAESANEIIVNELLSVHPLFPQSPSTSHCILSSTTC
jgi:hypothetical protein